HLLTDADIATAMAHMHACLRPGGGCLLTVRDYAAEPRGQNILKPYGVRLENGRRHTAFQIWDFDGDCYDLTLFQVDEELATKNVTSKALRARYYAIGTDKLISLISAAGFVNVRRLDGVFYQPVLVGTKA